MLTSTIINEINKRVPYLIQSYGGIDMFIIYLKEQYGISTLLGRRFIARHKLQKALNLSYTILNYSENLHIISPWSINISLFDLDEYGRLGIDSIDLARPYQVYNTEGYLLYSVTDHVGYFGNSRLDRDLVNTGLNTQAYFLKYYTINNKQIIKLLMVNTHTAEVAIKNEQFKSTDRLLTNVVTLANFSSSDVDVIYLQDVPSDNPNISIITEFGIVDTIQPGSSVILNPIAGTWLYLNTAGTITRPTITNPSNDIIIPVSINPPVYLYYIGFKTDPGLLNKLYGLSLAYTDKRILETIEINA